MKFTIKNYFITKKQIKVNEYKAVSAAENMLIQVK